MAKCACNKPNNSCYSYSGVLLRNTVLANRMWFSFSGIQTQ
jgi:hypothetical protein